MDDTIIERTAITESPMELGQGYDIRTDSPVELNIFKADLGKEHISETEISKSKVELIKENSYEEKFKAWDIAGEFKVSVFMNLVSVSASGKYLTEKSTDSRKVSMSLTCFIQTVSQSVDVNKQSVQDMIEGTRLSYHTGTDATHIVTKIRWGGRATFTFSISSSNSTELEQIKAALELGIGAVKVSIGANASVDFKNHKILKSEKLELVMNGDFLTDQALPSGIEEAMKLFAQLPNLLRKENGGKGVPIGYSLSPIKSVARAMGTNISLDVTIGRIKDNIVAEISIAMDDIAKGLLELDQHYRELDAQKTHVPLAEITSVSKRMRMATFDRNDFVETLRDIVTRIRRENSEDAFSELRDALDGLRELSCSTSNVREFIAEGKPRQDFLEYLREGYGASFATRGLRLDRLIAKPESNDKPEWKSKLYVLFIDLKLWMEMNPTTASSLQLFRVLLDERDTDSESFLIVDRELVDVKSAGVTQTYATVRRYRHGVLDCEDLYRSSFGVALLSPRVRLDTSSMKQGDVKKSDKDFYMVCPGRFQHNIGCPDTIHRWVCATCLQHVTYSYNQRIYCQCGSCEVKSCRFKCEDIRHGSSFLQMHPSNHKLSTSAEEDDINILLVGETGHGKSTLVGAFPNYILFDSLDEALDNLSEVLVPIPVKFVASGATVNGAKQKPGEVFTVEFGNNNDNNENLNAGQSATQHCKSYRIPWYGKNIRFIDVPGIGDTRGIEQDQKNVDNIMKFISQYRYINAVCFVLKPNEPRLRITFSYVMTELLSRLHENAVKNILFLFTSSETTNYDIGDTYTPLSNLLGKLTKERSLRGKNMDFKLEPERMYFFDNEGYRMACAEMKGVSYDESTVTKCRKSWTKSVESAKRLIDYVTTIPPHPITETTSLNRVKKTILHLAEPLRRISDVIDDNLKIIQKKKDDLSHTDSSIQDLESKLMVDTIELDTIPLAMPTTVCTKESCIQREMVCGNILQTIYSTKCHVGCFIKTDPYTVAASELRNCDAFLGDTCSTCRSQNGQECYWQSHMHVMVELRKRHVKVPIESVAKKIQEQQEPKRRLAAAIAELQEREEELKEEQICITKVSAKFAVFLQTNSLVPTNNYALQYVDIQIEQAKKVDGEGSESVTRLKEMKRTQKTEIQIIQDAIKSSENEGKEYPDLNSESIQADIQKLYSLKHNGVNLKRSLEVMKNTEVKHFPEVHIPVDVGAKQKAKHGLSLRQVFTTVRKWW